MAFERAWPSVLPQAFTANGTQFGLVTVADSCLFRVKQTAYLINTAGTFLAVQVKKVISPTQLIVGTINNAQIGTWPPLDISSWTVASGAAIGAEEQQKNRITNEDHQIAIYEGDPVVADRVVPVDCNGNIYGVDNPIPVSIEGTISIGQVEVIGVNGNIIEPNPDGSINVIIEPVPVSGQNVVSKYNEVIAVASGATIVIVSYTVPVNTKSVLQRVHFSGENIGRYDLLINNITQDTAHTMFGGDLTGEFDWFTGNDSGFLLFAGDVVKIQVNNPRPYIANYAARIQVLEIAL